MSSSSPSPTSDETPSERERQRLRTFVNEVTAIDRQASMSPRSAVLSHSSLHTRPHSKPAVDPSSAVVGTRPHHRKRSKRRHHTLSSSASASQALELARPSALSQLVDVDISRKNPVDEVMRLRQILKTVEKHAVLETQRATELQRANQEAQLQVQLLNETKLVAEQEALKAQQEKRLYQLQLDSAQKEIERTQEAVKRAERQREEAEAEVARARAKARKLHEQQLMVAAREEGRRLGFEAGFEHARAERQAARAVRKKANSPKDELKPIPIEHNPSNRSRVDKGKGKERAFVEDEEEITPYRSNLQYTQVPPTRQSLREKDDIISSPDGPDMSPSALKIKNLPAFDSRPPSMRAGPSNTSPLRPFKPPTASHSDSSARDAPPPNFQPFSQPQVSQPQPQLPAEHAHTMPEPAQQQSPRPPTHAAPIRSPTPEMYTWSVDVPTQSQLNVSMPVPATHLPRDQWVSAEKHLKRPSPPPQFPGGPPPMHIPPPQSHPKSTPTKAVKFPLLSRPSLLKTKQQATSWYRSLSIRKKSRPVIDPEEPPTTASTSAPSSAPISAPLNTASTVNLQPQGAPAPPAPATGTTESAGMYGRQQSQPVMSWYQQKQSSVPAPPTVRSQYSKHRPTSDMMSVSTRVSQFDLLSTPYIASQSVKSGKEGARKVKEKESYMSVIKENPFSRENTPNVDRYLPAGDVPGGHGSESGPSGPFVPQPDFGQVPQFPQPSLHQSQSYATFESSNKRNSRRPPPPGISVPDPDDVLEPAGAAYARHIRSMSGGNGGDQKYPGADLSRRPSKISERTVPDTSIEIDVVPPSGFAPDIPHSPPHTGINHLSPYRTYGNTTASQHHASPRVAAVQSVTSLRTQGGTRIEPLVIDRPNPVSASASRSKSRQSLNMYTDPAPLSYPQRPPSTTSRAPSRSNQEHNNYQENTSRQSYGHSHGGRPESVRSSGSASRALLQARPINAERRMDAPSPAAQGQGQGHYLVDRPSIQRMKSSTSLRSVGSYSKYKPEEYVDPAFWSADGPGQLMQRPNGEVMNNGRAGSMYRQERPASRAASVNSGLSYV